MRRHCAESMRLMQATPSDRKIGHAVRNTCVNSVKLPVCALSRFTPKDLKIGRTVSSWNIFWDLECSEFSGSSSSKQNVSKYTHKNTVRAPFFRRRVQLFFFSTRRTLTTDRTFSELVILLVVKGNAALSDVQGISYVCWACESVFHFGFLYYKPKSTSYSMCSSADSREIVWPRNSAVSGSAMLRL